MNTRPWSELGSTPSSAAGALGNSGYGLHLCNFNIALCIVMQWGCCLPRVTVPPSSSPSFDPISQALLHDGLPHWARSCCGQATLVLSTSSAGDAVRRFWCQCCQASFSCALLARTTSHPKQTLKCQCRALVCNYRHCFGKEYLWCRGNPWQPSAELRSRCRGWLLRGSVDEVRAMQGEPHKCWEGIISSTQIPLPTPSAGNVHGPSASHAAG